MKRYSGRFVIKSNRIKNWDYSTPGIYFITICTEDHEYLFGKIDEGKMIYSRSGEIAMECLNDIVKHFDNIIILKSVIMPNHVHILMEVKGSVDESDNRIDDRRVDESVETQFKKDVETREGLRRDVACYVSTNLDIELIEKSKYFSKISPKSNSVSTIIRSFKSAVTRKIGHNEYFSWQTRFYDEIIRDEKHLLFVKNYIINNIRDWKDDNYYINK